MLTGKPIWKENDMVVNKPLNDLTGKRKEEILNFYRDYYEKRF